MKKVDYKGHTFDLRTYRMIRWAEKKAGFEFAISQGSYNKSVAASAGTHDGGGAADFSVRLLLPWKRNRMLKALKDAGFAAWYRTTRQGFDTNHIHAIAIGCDDLAALAKSQVVDYDKGLDGLRGHAKDKSYRPNPPVRFNMVKNQPMPRKVK